MGRSLRNTTIAFFHTKNENVISLKANIHNVSILSSLGCKIHSVNGYKGDLLKIIVQKIKQKLYPSDYIKFVLTKNENLSNFFKKEILYNKFSTNDFFIEAKTAE